jgi:hypothetical protein
MWLWLLYLVALGGAAAACGEGAIVNEERLVENTAFTWSSRNAVRAFYSGHSLSDGVPEAVARIAAARQQTFDFNVQSVGYSLLKDRQPNADFAAAAWDAVVVTERHDLAWAAAHEGTAVHLADLARKSWQQNPDADVFFYHSWLPLDRSAPQSWIAYERTVLRLWECVASRANLDVARDDARIRVLPGGRALADLVELLWDGRVPGISAVNPADRIGLLFDDNVHLSPAGKAYMGLLHYAVLFGQPPTGSPDVAPLTRETLTFLEALAQEQAVAYARVADAASQRGMEPCRGFAVNEMPRVTGDLPAWSWRERLMRPYKTWSNTRTYRDAASAGNPFGTAK